MPVAGSSAYTEAETLEVLIAVVAWAGNIPAAHRQLKAEGKHVPSESGIRTWVQRYHADRYNELREKYSQQMEAQLAHEYRDVARLASDGERKAIERAIEGLDAGTDRDPSRTAANLATVMDKNTTKLLALTGRPTSIREDRNLNEVMRSLVARGILQLPEGEVAEEPNGLAKST
jgi:hypothetical protein